MPYRVLRLNFADNAKLRGLKDTAVLNIRKTSLESFLNERLDRSFLIDGHEYKKV